MLRDFNDWCAYGTIRDFAFVPVRRRKCAKTRKKTWLGEPSPDASVSMALIATAGVNSPFAANALMQ